MLIQGTIISICKAVLLIAFGGLALRRSKYSRVFIPRALYFYAFAYGSAALVHNSIYFYLLAVQGSASQIYIWSFLVRSISYIALALVFWSLVRQAGLVSDEWINRWLAVVAVITVICTMVPLLMPESTMLFLFTPVNYFYYLPRIILFGTMALFASKAMETKSLFLVGLSAFSIGFLLQDFLKLFNSLSHIQTIQFVMDTGFGLAFALLLIAGLYQDRINWAVYLQARKKDHGKNAVELYLSTIGFFQYLYTGLRLFTSSETTYEEGELLNRLHRFLQSAAGRTSELFTYQDLGRFFENDQMAFHSFVQKSSLTPIFREDGCFYFKRDDLLRAIARS